METANLLLLILAVFVALCLAVFQYIFKNKEKSQLNYWLSFLRFGSLFLILLLIINPSIKKEQIEIVKPNLIVAVDNSSSIKYNSQDSIVRNLVEEIKKNSALNSMFTIEYYSFGKDVKKLDSLSFNQNNTNLSAPLTSFSKVYTKGLNPVVLITDGNQTVGNTVEFSNYKSPVFPFIVGDTTVVEDIYIHQLNVNENTFINNQFPVEVFVSYKGGKIVTKELSVYHKGKKIYSKTLNFSKSNNVSNESFFLTAETKGIQYYTIKIETLENERNTLNNTKDFSINVIEDKSEIALLTSVIHPDLGMFKKAVESNKQRSVSIYEIDKFELDLSKYQLIILYQPNEKFKDLFQEIKSKNKNYFIVTGLNTNWNFLNTTQLGFKKEAITVGENYSPMFNAGYSSFMSTDIGFSTFSPIEDYFGKVTFTIPYQTYLFQKIGAIATEEPLLTTFENNSQKGGVLFGENAWRWRMSSFNNTKSFELFDGFISSLMQYLISNSNSNRLSVVVNPIYYSNETIQISVNYLDKNFKLDTRAKVWLTISNEKNKYLNKIPFALVNNHFYMELSNLPAADYTYTVSVENDTEQLLGNFRVLPFEIEQQFTQSDSEALKKVASRTQGDTYYNNQENILIQNLLNDTRFKSIQKVEIVKTPLIDWKWILGLILFLLSVEWFTRKYFGKI